MNIQELSDNELRQSLDSLRAGLNIALSFTESEIVLELSRRLIESWGRSKPIIQDDQDEIEWARDVSLLANTEQEF